MPEVKRYQFKGAAGEYVYANDFDRVTAERDVLAQNLKFAEEGSQSFAEECDALQQRLTAADERADVQQQRLTELQRQLGERWSEISAYQDTVEKQSERADVLEGLLISWLKDFGRTHSGLQRLKERTQAALKLAEAARCCTVSAEDRALLEAGDYTPEELFGVGGKPSCPKCAKP